MVVRRTLAWCALLLAPQALAQAEPPPVPDSATEAGDVEDDAAAPDEGAAPVQPAEDDAAKDAAEPGTEPPAAEPPAAEPAATEPAAAAPAEGDVAEEPAPTPDVAPAAEPPPALVEDAPAPTEAPAGPTEAPATTAAPSNEPAPKDGKAPKKNDDAANAAAAGNLALMAGGKSWVFRGSSVTFRNLLAARSLLPSFEQTYNPEFTNVISFSPVVWWGNVLNVSGYVDVSREWTHSDLNSYEGELTLSDTFLSVGANNFWTIPFVGIGMSANSTLRLPTSKWSWGQTLVGQASASYTLFRFFPLLSGLVVGYTLSGGKAFHQFTTGQNESSLESGGCFTPGICGIYASNGVRNPEWVVTNRLFGTFNFTSWLGVYGDFRVINQRLYPFVNSDPSITFFPDNPTGTENAWFLAPHDWRHAFRVLTSFYITPHPAVTFLVGTDTFSPQLGPNGKYQVPGINRWTYVYADMQVNFGGVASLFFD